MMKTFRTGGVHPPEMKQLSEKMALERVEAPELVVLPVSQHIGAPAKTIVAVGDVVAKGQVIAEANGFVSVPVHASVSGKVKAIEQRTTPLGKVCDHIIIENDGEDRLAEGVGEARDVTNVSPKQIKAIVRDAGIVGMGGAAFPTHVKLSPPDDRPIDLVLLNGVECEPYLTCDHRLMLERAGDVVAGLRLIMKALGVERAIIGIEANKPDAYEAMVAATKDDAGISVSLLTVKYPQGAEKQLIDALAGREVPPGRLPLDVGVVVHNVATAHAIFEAVSKSMPLIARPVTVTGEGIERPANLIVPLGTSIRDLLVRQGVSPKTKKLILGGPMMGIAVPDPDIPVVKGTSGVLALTKIPRYLPGPCLRCGKCIEVCPLRGMAAEMVAAIEAGEVEKYEHLHVLDCMECGTCTFACPSQRPIVHYVKRAKAELAAWKAEQKHKEKT